MRARRIAAVALAAMVAGSAAAQQASAPAPSASFGNLPLARDDGRATAPWGFSEVLGALVLFGVLVGALQYVRRRTGAAPWGWPRKPNAGPLQAVGATRLAPGATLHVVHWGDEELLVACTASAVTLLARRPCAAPEIRP